MLPLTIEILVNFYMGKIGQRRLNSLYEWMSLPSAFKLILSRLRQRQEHIQLS